jgi:hypothetical protein
VDNGFKALLGGVMLAALLFAILSVMPGVSTLGSSKSALGSIAAPASVSSTPVIAQAPALPQPATQKPTVPSSTPEGDNKQPQAKQYVFLQEEEKLPPKRWLYANGDVILRKEPQGDPFIPLSASFAPLTIHSGTRLWPVRTEAEWVMVQSPGNTVGWVHKDEVFTNDSGQSGSYYNLPAPRRPWLQ